MQSVDSTYAALMQSSTDVGEFVSDVEHDINSVCAVLKMPIPTIQIYKERLLDSKYIDDEGLHQICETYRNLKKTVIGK